MIFEGTILWLVLAVVVVLWLPQNFAHEGAHALAARHWGATITKLWPFPNTHNGYFSFAYVMWDWDEEPSDTARGVISAAPQIVNTVLLAILIAIKLGIPDVPTAVASVISAWALVNFIDGAVNLSTFYRPEPKPSTDGWKWQTLWGLNPWACRLLVVIWQLGFGSLLFL